MTIKIQAEQSFYQFLFLGSAVRCRMYKTESEMIEAAGLVHYEWNQFLWAASEIDQGDPEKWFVGTGSVSEFEAALVEVYLLHGRVLRDFFNRARGDRGVHTTDILAVDFFDEPVQWKKPTFSYISQNKVRLDRALAHLSYDRIAYELTGKNWNANAITAELKDAWATFLTLLTEERRAWFDREK